MEQNKHNVGYWGTTMGGSKISCTRPTYVLSWHTMHLVWPHSHWT